MIDSVRAYPRTVSCNGTEIRLALMSETDEPAVLAFANTLPPNDLLFMRRDIRNPRVVAAWADLITQGRLASLLAWHNNKVVGCAALIIDRQSWSPHVAELRTVVSPDMRGTGLGRTIIQDAFIMALEMGLEKLMAHMTVDQQAAIAVFEGLGFRGEALLREHVRGPDGRKHDIVVLSHDVARVQSQMEAYGMTEAF